MGAHHRALLIVGACLSAGARARAQPGRSSAYRRGWNGQAERPPMAWRSWNSFGNHINASIIFSAVGTLASCGRVAAPHRPTPPPATHAPCLPNGRRARMHAGPAGRLSAVATVVRPLRPPTAQHTRVSAAAALRHHATLPYRVTLTPHAPATPAGT